MPTSFAELIERLGNDSVVATYLGLERGHVKSMRRRDSVAPEHWPALEKAAAAGDIGVGVADFMRWRGSRTASRVTPANQPEPEAVP